MDELNEYLSKAKKDDKIGELKFHMKSIIEIMSETRKSRDIQNLCQNFMDDFYDIAEIRGIDL